MKSRILIIEDNQAVRENLSEILRLSGYDTLTAANGTEGVRRAQEGMPDLILCDIMMPELDGYGVLRILSRNPQTAYIPFIFLTAKTEVGDIRKGMTLGADDYITKPFDDVELLDTIEMRLKKSRSEGRTESVPSSFTPLVSWEQLVDSIPENLKDSETRLIHRKDILYAEGQTCRNVYIIRRGKGMAIKIDDYSKEVVIRLYKAPMIIGIVSALMGGGYHETVKALEDLEVMPVKKDDFLQFIRQNVTANHFLIHMLAVHDKLSAEKLLLQAFGTVRMKLAATLLDLYSFYEKDGVAVIPVSREDLASMAGTAKETIIRCLSEFKDEGLVTIRDTDIVIDSAKKLAELRY